MAFLTNRSFEEASTEVNQDQPLSIEKNQLFREAIEATVTSAGPAGFDHFIGRILTHRLDGGRTVGEAIRADFGGGIEPPDGGDPLLRPLLEIARDSLPALLVTSSEIPDFALFSMATTFDHPSRNAFLAAALADEAIGSLFATKADDPLAIEGSIATGCMRWTSDGHGSGLQLATLDTTLIGAAAQECLLRAPSFGATELYTGLERVVERLRGLCAEGKGSVPVFIGLAGPKLPRQAEISLPFGRITTFSGRAPRIGSDATATMLFETEAVIEQRLDPLGGSLADFPFQKEQRQLGAQIEMAVQQARLALVLGTHGPSFGISQPLWQVIADPVGYGRYSSWLTTRSLPVAVKPDLDTADCRTVEQYASWTDDRYDPSIRIPVRRLLSALTDRHNPEDGLMDGVIALDGLFGAVSEARLRVPGSTAHLLEPDDKAARKALFEEVKGLYGDRSGVAHGGRELSWNVAIAKRDRVCTIAADCLRTLFRDYPNLIALPSEQRSLRLLQLSTDENSKPSGRS